MHKILRTLAAVVAELAAMALTGGAAALLVSRLRFTSAFYTTHPLIPAAIFMCGVGVWCAAANFAQTRPIPSRPRTGWRSEVARLLTPPLAFYGHPRIGWRWYLRVAMSPLTTAAFIFCIYTAVKPLDRTASLVVLAGLIVFGLMDIPVYLKLWRERHQAQDDTANGPADVATDPAI